MVASDQCFQEEFDRELEKFANSLNFHYTSDSAGGGTYLAQEARYVLFGFEKISVQHLHRYPAPALRVPPFEHRAGRPRAE
jgi:hypothetical protein